MYTLCTKSLCTMCTRVHNVYKTEKPSGMTCLSLTQVRQHLHSMGKSAAATPKALSDTLRARVGPDARRLS
jgi:hypothetical protein